MPSFGQVQLPTINPLFDLASIDKNVNAINGGRLANQLASNTLDSNTQIAANHAEGGRLANQFAEQNNPLEIIGKRQILGIDPSPTLDRLQGLYSGGTGTLSSRESGDNPAAINGDGYAGMFQHGTARLADVGFYAPAQGEDLGTNQWKGSLNIPGYPDVKTLADFTTGPHAVAAQRTALAAEVAQTDAAIAATPGADRLNANGLRAVAHLGGVAGMQKFVSTNGAYNPRDKNGTHLSDYYNQFSKGGPAALLATFGHPDGQHLPETAQPAGAPGVTLAPEAAAPVAAPVQTATRGPVPGDTASDAGPAPGFDANGDPLPSVPPVAAPTGQGAPPQVQNPNSLLAVAGPQGGAPPPAPQNSLAPPAAPVAQSGTGVNSPQFQQAQDLQRRATQIEIAAAATPHDPRAKAAAAAMAGDLRNRAAAIMATDSVTVLPDGTQLHPITGKIDNAAMPAHNPARVTKVDGPGGSILTQPGAPDRLIPYSGRPEQTDAYKTDITKADALTGAAQSAQASMPRLNEMADLAGQLSTGPTAELRAKGAALLEQAGASPEAIKRWTGMPSGSAAQEFIKLSIATAGSAAKADVGSNNGIQSTQLYQAANPNLSLMPDANKRITNMMRVSAQSIQDYAQAALDHFGKNEATFLKGGDYAPLTTFSRQWQAQSNPQVYAAATGILNGDSFEKWSSKITPADGARAAQIAARVDPSVQIPLKGGGMRPVGDVLSHPSIAPPAGN